MLAHDIRSLSAFHAFHPEGRWISGTKRAFAGVREGTRMPAPAARIADIRAERIAFLPTFKAPLCRTKAAVSTAPLNDRYGNKRCTRPVWTRKRLDGDVQIFPE